MKCAGRPARSRWCKSIAVKEELDHFARYRAIVLSQTILSYSLSNPEYCRIYATFFKIPTLLCESRYVLPQEVAEVTDVSVSH
jgi:hypothetical protein